MSGDLDSSFSVPVNNTTLKSLVVRRAGWLYRGSEVVEYVFNRRKGVLYSDIFVTHRKEDDKDPSKIWPLHSTCVLTNVENKQMMLAKVGLNNILAWITGKYKKINGYIFTVSWPRTKIMKDTILSLGFENENSALQWHSDFAAAIKSASVSRTDRIPAIVYKVLPEGSSSSMDLEEPPRFNSNFSTTLSCAKLAPATNDIAEANLELMGDINLIDQNRLQTVCSSENASKSSENEILLNNIEIDREAPRASSQWRPIKMIHGMAVYYEEDESGGAYMVSLPIHAPPKDCLETLSTGSFLLSCSDVQLIRRDGDLEILRLKMQPVGLGSWFLTSRDLLIERLWREEEDGTIVLLFRSHMEDDSEIHESTLNENRTAKYKLHSWFTKPVKAKIPAAGFTISPLRAEYCTPASRLSESLVTLVLKMDLGGVCGARSPFRFFFDSIGISQAWIDRILTTLIVLRESVEQKKFKVHLSQSLKTEPSFRRTTTTILRERFQNLECISELVEEKQQANYICPLDKRGLLDPRSWRNPGSAGFRVRGANYLLDKKKVLAEEPKFILDWVYLLKLEKPTPNIAKYLPALRKGDDEFSFVVQIMIPGPPHMCLVIGWVRFSKFTASEREANSDSDKKTEIASLDPFDKTLLKFINGSDEVRNTLFKLIPKVVEGSWIIRQSVGHTPVLMGRKLKQYYFSGLRHFEVDIDVSSSRPASTVVGLVQGATRSLTVDLAVLLEGKRKEELPESLLGTVRLDHVDLDTAIPLRDIMTTPISPPSPLPL